MLFITVVFLALMAFKVTPYPHAEPGSIQPLEITSPKRRVTHHVEPPSNTTLTARAEKGICTDLELPTEASYKIGYESFCTSYVCSDCKVRMGTTDPPLVATYMLKTHIGTTIPWIFKIASDAWGGGAFFLKRDMCLTGFRAMLEGERAKVGTNYCVVDGSGGNGESKGFSGQGYVLVMGDRIRWTDGDVNQLSSYETRRRKGEFDPENLGGEEA